MKLRQARKIIDRFCRTGALEKSRRRPRYYRTSTWLKATGRVRHQFAPAAYYEWPIGPWWREPVRAEWWRDGLHCLALRHPRLGTLCGYVGVPQSHPLYGLGYDHRLAIDDALHNLADPDISSRHVGVVDMFLEAARDPDGTVRLSLAFSAHGGLTFAGDIPEGRHDLWYFGFDCAHAGDKSPGLITLYRRHSISTDGFFDCEYRSLRYVRCGVSDLADQLNAYARQLAVDVAPMLQYSDPCSP